MRHIKRRTVADNIRLGAQRRRETVQRWEARCKAAWDLAQRSCQETDFIKRAGKFAKFPTLLLSRFLDAVEAELKPLGMAKEARLSGYTRGFLGCLLSVLGTRQYDGVWISQGLWCQAVGCKDTKTIRSAASKLAHLGLIARVPTYKEVEPYFDAKTKKWYRHKRDRVVYTLGALGKRLLAPLLTQYGYASEEDAEDLYVPSPHIVRENFPKDVKSYGNLMIPKLVRAAAKRVLTAFDQAKEALKRAPQTKAANDVLAKVNERYKKPVLRLAMDPSPAPQFVRTDF